MVRRFVICELPPMIPGIRISKGFFALQTEMVELLFTLAQSNFTKIHKIPACCGAGHQSSLKNTTNWLPSRRTLQLGTGFICSWSRSFIKKIPKFRKVTMEISLFCTLWLIWSGIRPYLVKQTVAKCLSSKLFFFNATDYMCMTLIVHKPAVENTVNNWTWQFTSLWFARIIANFLSLLFFPFS